MPWHLRLLLLPFAVGYPCRSGLQQICWKACGKLV